MQSLFEEIYFRWFPLFLDMDNQSMLNQRLEKQKVGLNIPM